MKILALHNTSYQKIVRIKGGEKITLENQVEWLVTFIRQLNTPTVVLETILCSFLRAIFGLILIASCV